MDIQKIRLVGIGDSWMAGYSDVSKADEGGLLSYLPPDRFSFINLAVSGSTAEQWAADFDGRLSQSKKLSDACDCYIVSLGGNDARAYIDEQSEGGILITDEERRQGMACLVKVLSDLRSTGKRVLVMTYTNPYVGNVAAEIGVDFLNLAILRATDSADVPMRDIVKTRKVLGEEGMMSGIGIHPSSPTGYIALARLVERMLK